MNLKFIFKTLILVLFFSASHGFSHGENNRNISEVSLITDAKNSLEISPASQHLFGLMPKSETTVLGFNAKPLTFENNFVKYNCSLEYIEEQLLVEFKHNNEDFLNCLVNYRKSDLIFPFHYFW